MKLRSYREELQVVEKKTGNKIAARAAPRSAKPAAKAAPQKAPKAGLAPKTEIQTPSTDVSRPNTDAMSAVQLAKAVLAGEIRPRVGEVRRLAEAVIEKPAAKKKKPKKGKAKKADRKLAKIPGQGKKKKK